LLFNVDVFKATNAATVPGAAGAAELRAGELRGEDSGAVRGVGLKLNF
jgi:hypothetical protein